MRRIRLLPGQYSHKRKNCRNGYRFEKVTSKSITSAATPLTLVVSMVGLQRQEVEVTNAAAGLQIKLAESNDSYR